MHKKSLARKQFNNQYIPSELFELAAMFQNMRATDKVDYLKIKYKLVEALKKRKQENDFVFEWCQLSPRQSPRTKNPSPEDSARKKKKMEQMNEENQQIVQNDIYEVYKFMEKEKKEEKPEKR